MHNFFNFFETFLVTKHNIITQAHINFSQQSDPTHIFQVLSLYEILQDLTLSTKNLQDQMEISLSLSVENPALSLYKKSPRSNGNLSFSLQIHGRNQQWLSL